MVSARLPAAHCRPSLLGLFSTMLFFWSTTGLLAQTDPTIAVWKGGDAEWTDTEFWEIDGMPAETNNIIPGTVSREFWKVIIDDSGGESNVILDGAPTFPGINELDITQGDSLQIKTPLRVSTRVVEGSGGKISNSGSLFVVENGSLIILGSNMSPPDGGILTLSGGGNLILDGEPGPLGAQGASITGGGPEPRVFINEDNTISGTGQLGRGGIVLVNRQLITADQEGKRLIVDPGVGFEDFPDDFSNKAGAVLSATNGGILELRGGAFRNAATAEIIAGMNSFVHLANAAHVIGGRLESGFNGQFRVTGNASLTSVDLGFSNIDVLEGASLTLAGTLPNTSSRITLNGGTRAANLLIDGSVELTGVPMPLGSAATISLNARPSFIAGSPLSLENELTIGPGILVQGTGVIGDSRLSIINNGTILAPFGGESLFINAGSGPDFENTGTMQAISGGTLDLAGPWNLRGTGGSLAASLNSVIVLDGVRVAGQRLTTPHNGSLMVPAADIDTGQGVIRTRANSTVFDLRSDPPSNEGLLEIPGTSTLTLRGQAAAGDEMPPALANSGAIFLNAGQLSSAFLNVGGGDVRLTGGGRVVLSDSQNNQITQSALEPQVNTLINVDNVIEGSGKIGGGRLNFRNEFLGTVLAGRGGELVIDTPPDVDAVNLGVLSTREDGTLILRNNRLTNEFGGFIRAEDFGTFRIDGGSLVNRGTVEAESALGLPSTSVIEGTGVLNTGIIAATGGGVIQLRSTPVLNASGDTQGTIAAGDASAVELSGNTLISGGRLATSANGTIRVVDQAGIVLPLTNGGLLEVSEDATLNVIGGTVLNEDALIFFPIAMTIPLENQGTISLNSSDLVIFGTTRLTGGGEIILSDDPGNTISGFVEKQTPIVFNEDNSIRGAGTIAGTFLLINDFNGKIVADGVNPLNVATTSGRLFGTRPFNFGLMRAEGSGGIALFNTAGPGLNDPLINGGTIEVVAGSKMQMVSGSVLQNGEIPDGTREVTVPDGRTFTVYLGDPSPGSIVIDGRFDGEIVNVGASRVSGSGLLNGELVSAGKFQPGQSPGTFTIVGTFEQLPGGELEIELAGTEAGSQYDQLIVDGTAMLDGTVVVKHTGGFASAAGTEFDVLTATTLVDNGFSLAPLDGGLVRPAVVDAGDGTTALRLTSIEGKRYAEASGSWDTAANWTGGTLPASDDTAFIPGDPSADTTVTGPAADTTVHSLVVGSGDEAATSATTLGVGQGIITTTRGATLRLDARLTGQGILGGDLYNAGTVAPGQSPGAVAIAGNYHQAETGTLALELGGTTPGDQFDQLTIGGTAALDGTLDVVLIDVGEGPFEPQGGNTFPLLTAEESVGGLFATANLPPLAESLTWNLDYLPNSVELRAALTGDYNNSGLVEQADLDLVLGNWGGDAGLLPPMWINQRPTEGLVDQAELDAVLSNWGNSLASLATPGAAAVPEPATALLLMVAIIGLHTHRAGHWKRCRRR